MEENLRIDLLMIVLEEAFKMHESYARRAIAGQGLERFKAADSEALAAAMHLVDRIEARCSRIEG